MRKMKHVEFVNLKRIVMSSVEICKGCNRPKIIVNKKFFLCDDCNQIRLHRKTRNQRRFEKLKNRQIKHKIKKIKFRKPTGEAALFKEIWEEREHICHNCKIPLGDEMKTFFFMHVKAKSTHGKLRLVKTNIELACYDCHTAYDRVGMEAYNSRKNLYSSLNK